MSDESDLVKGVRGWLEKQGYPLEMRVAALFEQSGFGVGRSTYFVHEDDPPRELDVVAIASIDDERFVWRPENAPRTSMLESEHRVLGVSVVFVIECKGAPPNGRHPWIVFTQEFGVPSAFATKQFPMTELARRSVLTIKAQHRDAILPLLTEPSKRGVSIVEASLGHSERKGNKASGADGDGEERQEQQKKERKEDGFNVAYAAVKKVATASRVMVEQVDALTKKLFRVVVPVVVTTCPLVECRLEAGKMLLEERGILTVRSSKPLKTGSTQSTLVHVVREDRLESFLSSIRMTMNTLEKHVDTVVTTRVETGNEQRRS